MNSGIIPQGPSEVVTDTAVITREILVATALTDVAFTGLSFTFPATPANADVIAASTLPAGSQLFNVAGITVTTGQLYVVYRK
jgi:hypothetical protein